MKVPSKGFLNLYLQVRAEDFFPISILLFLCIYISFRLALIVSHSSVNYEDRLREFLLWTISESPWLYMYISIKLVLSKSVEEKEKVIIVGNR